MKKAIKKVGLVVTMFTMMTVSLAGCAKTTTCEGCDEKKKCHQYEVTALGQTEKGWLCDDCYEEMNAACALIGGSIKKIK